jgi:hypothetical protein
MMLCVSRWLKKHRWVLVADGGFTCSQLAFACVRSCVAFICRFRLDARLFDFPGNKTRVGRPSPAGKRLHRLKQLIEGNKIAWEKVTVQWYGGRTQKILIE